VHDARSIVHELEKYDPALFAKPRWLVLNKLDLIPEDERAGRVQAFLDAYKPEGPVFRISAINGEGCVPLTWAIADFLVALRKAEHLSGDTAALPYPDEEPEVATDGATDVVTDDGAGDGEPAADAEH